jgi:signal peptidase I
MRMLHRRVAPALLGLIVISVLVALWPARLGGAVTHVSTHGSSMEPRFHQGDLVIVRSTSTYRVGDVVAYHSRLLDTVVLHRIVAVEDGHYVMKGDNNSWLDAERPTTSELIGRTWVQVPRGGALVSRWTPIIGLTLGAAVAFGGGITATVSLRRRSGRIAMPLRHHDLSRCRRWRLAAVAFAACAATSALVAAYAWREPATSVAVTRLPFTQRAEFSYAAAAPTSVYEGGHLTTGDPIFLRTARTLDLTATYAFSADSSHTVRGSIGLSAEIRDGSGWHRSFELAPPAPFDGARAVRTAQLDLGSLQEQLAAVRAATGASSGSYLVDVVANITVAGQVDGRPMGTTFTPRLELQLDSVRLGPRAQGGPGETAFTESATGHLSAPHRHDNRAGVGGVTIPIGTLRVISVGAAVATALAAGIAIVALRRGLPDEAAKIALRYGRHVVPIRATELRSGVGILEVSSMGDLVRLAAQPRVLILHERASGTDIFHVQIDHTLYRYVIGVDRMIHRDVSGRDGTVHAATG